MKKEFQILLNAVKIKYPKLKIRFKNESNFMKFIGFFIKIFNKNFMTSVTTTIGNTIYFPNSLYLENPTIKSIEILSHEVVHVHDYNKNKLLFVIKYLFPQIFAILAVFSIFAIFSLWFLWFLVFLIFLLPFPAPFRKDLELRGYIVSSAIYFWLFNFLSEDSKQHFVKVLSGSSYYFSFPFKKKLSLQYEAIEEMILNGELESIEPFKTIKEAILSF